MIRPPASRAVSLALALAALIPAPARADEPAEEAPPRPSAAAQARLTAAARRVARGVLLVGHPEGGFGTAFVLDRRRRLVATAAHVADTLAESGSMAAIVGGTSTAYRVDRVWYHPGLIRRLDDGLSARSPDRADGEVDFPCLDVAVMRLAEGPPLPEDCPLADAQVLDTLPGRPAAALGYSGFGGGLAEPFLRIGAPAPTPRLRTGVVVATTDFDLHAAPDDAGQLVEVTTALDSGDSGGPIFDAEGRVVALATGIRGTLGDDNQDWAVASFGVRADALVELLAYHGLLGPEAQAQAAAAGPAPDPRLDDLRTAVRLVDEARALAARGDYEAAGTRCNRALRLAPDYGGAYLERSKGYAAYVGHHWASLGRARKEQLVGWALDDIGRAFEHDAAGPETLLTSTQILLYRATLDDDREAYRLVLEHLEELIPLRGLLSPAQWSYALSCRAQARQFLGDLPGALTDYNEAIRLNPSQPTWYLNRSRYWARAGRPDLAASDRQVADRLRRRSP